MLCFDVVIVGTGPGGLKCAEVLAKSSLSVLMLEKNEEIGPKVCAGGLTGKDIGILNLPQHLIEYSFDNIKLHVHNVTTNITSDKIFACTIDRKEFGQWQLQLLDDVPNVSVRTGARVTEVTDEYVVANGEKIGYKYLVGADGSNSLVKKYLGFKSKNSLVGIQYIIPTDKYRELEMFFEPKSFSAWYTWIFPHRGYVSIGCCANPKILHRGNLKDNFHEWLKKQDIDIANARYEAFPMDVDFKGIHFGNVFLVGDAAGLVSPFTGEGIYQALITGEEVAKRILNPEYISDKIPSLIHYHKRHQRLLNLLINSGPLKSALFSLGQQLFKIRRIEQKAIDVFA